MAEYKFPTEVVDLPSKGYFYVDGHPLSSGKVEVKYMTAKAVSYTHLTLPTTPYV